jgi:hypothetical protein
MHYDVSTIAHSSVCFLFKPSAPVEVHLTYELKGALPF